jgi:KDO2-lipid IV(A) lauroyltransferase
MSRDLLLGNRLLKRTTWGLLRVLARDLWGDGARLLAHGAGDLLWWCDARGRRTVEANLRLLVPAREARQRAARATYRACAEGLAFTLRLDRLHPADLPDRQALDPWSVLPLRGPAVLASVHADWDALLACLHLHAAAERLAVIVLPAGDAAVDAMLAALRSAAGAETLPWLSSGRAALRHLRAGGVVGVLADRAYSGMAMAVTVGGMQLQLPTGPAELARRSGVPLIPAACLRTRDRTVVVLGKPIAVASCGLHAALQQLARFQIQVLTANPSRWIAFHPVARPTAAQR